MQRCVAVIPARWASRRLPGKPLADLLGRPLVVRVWDRVRAAQLVDRVLVATDDERIAEAVRRAGGEAWLSPPGLASGSDRCAAAIDAMDEACDVVLNVQGDQPLVVPADLDRLVSALRQSGADAATGWRPASDEGQARSHDRVKLVADPAGRALYFSRQPIPHGGPWRIHVGLYAFRPEALRQFASSPRSALERAEDLEQLRLLEDGLTIHAVQLSADAPSVDTPEDLRRVRALFAA